MKAMKIHEGKGSNLLKSWWEVCLLAPLLQACHFGCSNIP